MAMPLNEEQTSLLQDFLTETSEHLQVAEGGLLHLEAAPDDSTVIRDIMRAMHTIKGSSSYFGFKEMADLAHGLENRLVEVGNGRAYLDSETMNDLLSGVDQLRTLMRDLTADAAIRTEDIESESEENPDLDEHRYLLFEVGHLTMALPVEQVVEVTRPVPITPLPHVEAAITGLVNLRGNVIPQVDLCHKLGGEPGDVEHLVLVPHGRGRVALGVRRVLGVTALVTTGAIQENGKWTGQIIFHQGNPVALLDLGAALDRVERAG